MAEIKSLIDMKNQPINDINAKMENEKEGQTKVTYLKIKENLLDEKNKLIDIRFQFNEMNKNNINNNQNKPIKRYNDNLDSEIPEKNESPVVLIKKGFNLEKTFKKLYKEDEVPNKIEQNEEKKHYHHYYIKL